MRIEFVKLKSCLLLLSVISILSLESLGGQQGFFAAWFGATSGDPYERLNPTAYWYPSVDGGATDRILGIKSTNTVNYPLVPLTQGWDFDGGQYLDFGYPAELEIGNSTQYTMAAWVYSTDVANFKGIMGKSISGGGADRWHLRQVNGAHEIILGDAEIFEVQVVSASGAVQNTWFHLVAVIDRGVTGGMRLYRDGVQVASTTFSSLGPITYAAGNAPFRIGSYGDASGNPGGRWKGYIDQAAVWNGRALTSNEVYQLFEQTRSGRK